MPVIRQQSTYVNRPVGVSRIDTGADLVANAVAKNADHLSQMLFRKAADVAEKRGLDRALSVNHESITTINPVTGKPEPFQAPRGFGSIAQDAYEKVINRRFEESMDRELRLKAQELAVKYTNPETYAREMSLYIQDMSNDATGRYKSFIEENGTYYLASTKANLQAKAAAAARDRARDDALASLGEQDQMIVDLYLAGKTDEALVLFNQQIAHADDVGLSGLISTKQAEAAQKNTNGALSYAIIQKITSDISSEKQALAVTQYLSSNGQINMGVPEEWKGPLDSVIQRTDYSDLMEWARFAGGLSETAVARIEYNMDIIRPALEATEAMVADAREWVLNLKSNREDAELGRGIEQFASSFSSTFNKGVNASDPEVRLLYWQSIKQYGDLAIDAASDSNFEVRRNSLQSMRDRGDIDDTRFNQLEKTIREGMMNPPAYYLSSILNDAITTDEVISAIQNERPWAGITQVEREIFDFLISDKSPINHRNQDDMKYLQGILELGKSTAAEQMAKNLLRDDFGYIVRVAENDLWNGGDVNIDELLLSGITDFKLDASYTESLRAQLEQARAGGPLVRGSAPWDSTDMKALTAYINNPNLEVPAHVKELADNWLAGNYDDGTKRSVLDRLSSIISDKVAWETEQAGRNKTRIVFANLSNGVPQNTNPNARVAADTYLSGLLGDNWMMGEYNAGISDEDAHRIIGQTLYSAVPESVLEGMRQFLEGSAVRYDQNADGTLSARFDPWMIEFYANYRNLSSASGTTMTNPFTVRGGLTEREHADMEVASAIWRTLGGEIGREKFDDVWNTYNTNRNSETFKAAFQKEFEYPNGYEYLRNEYDMPEDLARYYGRAVDALWFNGSTPSMIEGYASSLDGNKANDHGLTIDPRSAPGDDGNTPSDMAFNAVPIFKANTDLIPVAIQHIQSDMLAEGYGEEPFIFQAANGEAHPLNGKMVAFRFGSDLMWETWRASQAIAEMWTLHEAEDIIYIRAYMMPIGSDRNDPMYTPVYFDNHGNITFMPSLMTGEDYFYRPASDPRLIAARNMFLAQKLQNTWNQLNMMEQLEHITDTPRIQYGIPAKPINPRYLLPGMNRMGISE